MQPAVRSLLPVMLCLLMLHPLHAQVPTDGLVLHYRFSGNALDATSNNHGALRGATLAEDRFGQARSASFFNGTSAFIESQLPLPETDSITISLWLRLDSWVQLNNWGAPQVIFFEGDDGGGHDVACYVMGGFHFVVKTDAALSYPNWLPPVGSWTHLVCVADAEANIMSIWIDGKLANQTTFDGGANVGFHSRFNLGRRPGVYNDWFLAGAIDEVRVYDRGLTPAEITSLHTAEAGLAQTVQVAVDSVKITMHLDPGGRYILQHSTSLNTWTDFGAPFVPELATQTVTVQVNDTMRFWRVVQAP